MTIVGAVSSRSRVHAGAAPPLSVGEHAQVVARERVPVDAVGLGEVPGCGSAAAQGVLSWRHGPDVFGVDAHRALASEVIERHALRYRTDGLLVDPAVSRDETAPPTSGTEGAVAAVPRAARPVPAAGQRIDLHEAHEALHRRQASRGALRRGRVAGLAPALVVLRAPSPMCGWSVARLDCTGTLRHVAPPDQVWPCPGRCLPRRGAFAPAYRSVRRRP